MMSLIVCVFFFQAEDGIRDDLVTGVQTCALPISHSKRRRFRNLLRGRDVQELKELQRQGMSIQAISELTGWDRKTIRKYVQAAGWRRSTAHVQHRRASSMRLSRIWKSGCAPGCGTRGCCCANCASGTTQAATRF